MNTSDTPSLGRAHAEHRTPRTLCGMVARSGPVGWRSTLPTARSSILMLATLFGDAEKQTSERTGPAAVVLYTGAGSPVLWVLFLFFWIYKNGTLANRRGMSTCLLCSQ